MTETPFIVAATGCPTGVAHTFMAEAALKKAAAAKGIDIRVETHGQIGLEHELTPDEIARARGVIVAADKDVQAERFAGKHVVEVGVKEGIRNPGGLIDRLLAETATDAGPAGTGDEVARGATAGSTPPSGREGTEHRERSEHREGPTDENDFLNVAAIEVRGEGWRKAGRAVYKHLMNGVSHMLPFVVGGGVLVAASFLFGIYSADPTNAQYNPFAEMLMTVGGLGLGLMVPVLSAFIASSIASRPGLTVGLITGLLAANMGTGFLGGIVTGFLSGYGMLLLGRALSWLPKSLGGLKAIFLFPVLGTLVFGAITYLISSPMAAFSTGLQDALTGFQNANPILLGLVLGAMCAFDMGGPVNKAAYVTGVALLGDGNITFMAAVSAACIAPPLVTAIAVTLFPRGFEPGERRAGYVNYALGATHITEGAIPFAARNPLVVIPILMVASSIAAILSLLWGAGSPAPHGGFLVLPVVTNPIQWVIAILIGSVVGGVVYGAYRVWSAKRALRPVEQASASPVLTA